MAFIYVYISTQKYRHHDIVKDGAYTNAHSAKRRTERKKENQEANIMLFELFDLWCQCLSRFFSPFFDSDFLSCLINL